MKVLSRLFASLKPYRLSLLAIAGILVVQAGLELVPPLFQREIVDGVIGRRDLSRLGLLLGAMVATYALLRAVNFGDQFLRHALGERFMCDLRVALYGHLQRLSLSFFERTSTGELMSRLTSDVSALESFVTHGSSLTLVDFLRLAATAGLLYVLDWRLALAVTAALPVLAVALRWFNRRVRPHYRQVRAQLGVINAKLQDGLSGIRVIQAFGQEEAELQRFAAESEQYCRARVRAIRSWAAFFPAFRFAASIGPVLVLAVGAWLVVGDRSTLGTLVAVLSYTASFYEPLHRLTEVDNIIQQAIAAAERIYQLLDTAPEIRDGPGAAELPAVRGEVRFQDVHFHYHEGDPILHQVDFHIAPGEVAALVGPSGAGKTSIANLLCRFYDPVQGRVLLDGVELPRIRIAALRRHVAVVLQDTFLFNTTVRENIRFGKPEATQEQIVAAARAACAEQFILQLPAGYDTEIGERGVRLSGGQKQRLALARAILADPRVLILDEATSSVDAEAEYLIQQALQAVLKDRTALIIAHRLSTIRRADKIIALEGGRIHEVGNHRDLLTRGGLYSRLYRRQVEMIVDEGDPQD